MTLIQNEIDLTKDWLSFFKFTLMQSALIFSNFSHPRLLLSLLCLFLSCSADLSCYFDIPVNSMTNWPGLKLPKIVWPSPFKKRSNLLTWMFCPASTGMVQGWKCHTWTAFQDRSCTPSTSLLLLPREVSIPCHCSVQNCSDSWLSAVSCEWPLGIERPVFLSK